MSVLAAREKQKVIYNLQPVSNSCFSHNFPVFIQKSLCQQNVCLISPCSIVAVLHFSKCLDRSIDPQATKCLDCPHHHQRGEETLLHHETFTFFLTRTFRPFPALWSAKCYYRKVSHQRECTFCLWYQKCCQLETILTRGQILFPGGGGVWLPQSGYNNKYLLR